MKTIAHKFRSARKKPVVIAVSTVLGCFLFLGGIKALQIATMIKGGKNFKPPPETVTTAEVQRHSWETTITAVGSLTAVQGVTIAADQAGTIQHVAFTPGSAVEKGDLLVQQDISTEEAQLRAAVAAADLAKINLKRSKELITRNLISQSDYDAATAQQQSAVAQADHYRSLIEKKTIRAPFAGRIGTQKVRVGQYLQAGDPIVSLQALDPMYADFMLPQQHLGKISNGLPVRVETDAVPGKIITGEITSIDPEVNSATRNVTIQATLSNTEQQLLPGMFARIEVVLPAKEQVLAIPATAVIHATYGASVFVVEQQPATESSPAATVVRQQFVKLGEARGDYIAVTSGLNEKDVVVATGGFKLYSGQAVVANNQLAPQYELAPKLEDS